MRNNTFLPAMIGFEKLFNEFESAMFQEQKFPKYDVIKLSDTQTSIEIALAGYTKEDIDIELHKQVLKIEGKKGEDKYNEKQYLHKTVAKRNFKLGFKLAEHVEVESANMENGMLQIVVVENVPEEAKPRKIEFSKNDLENK